MREFGAARTWSSSKPVSAKCPRWLVPNWSSNPSCVIDFGVPMTPALLISRSMWSNLPRNSAAVAGERLADLETDACVSAGDDRDAIGLFGDIGCGPIPCPASRGALDLRSLLVSEHVASDSSIAATAQIWWWHFRF